MRSGPVQPTLHNGSSERVPAYNKQLQRTVIRRRAALRTAARGR
jgi:hypothetical protein